MPNSKSTLAANSIKKLAIHNGLTSGDKLPSQRQLAEQLRCSRPTIREALVGMEALGQIRTEPGRGVFLTDSGVYTKKVKPNNVSLAGKEAQMYQFRQAIEPAVAALVASNATKAQVEDMELTIRLMRKAIAENDFSEFYNLDFRFHSQIIEAANNKFFSEAISPFLDLFFESQKLPLLSSQDGEPTIIEHTAIIKSIKARDSAASKEAMQIHISNVTKRAGM